MKIDISKVVTRVEFVSSILPVIEAVEIALDAAEESGEFAETEKLFRSEYDGRYANDSPLMTARRTLARINEWLDASDGEGFRVNQIFCYCSFSIENQIFCYCSFSIDILGIIDANARNRKNATRIPEAFFAASYLAKAVAHKCGNVSRDALGGDWQWHLLQCEKSLNACLRTAGRTETE